MILKIRYKMTSIYQTYQTNTSQSIRMKSRQTSQNRIFNKQEWDLKRLKRISKRMRNLLEINLKDKMLLVWELPTKRYQKVKDWKPLFPSLTTPFTNLPTGFDFFSDWLISVTGLFQLRIYRKARAYSKSINIASAKSTLKSR